MTTIRGIDAVMIYADDPEALSAWYRTALGIATARSDVDGNYYGGVSDSETGHVIHFGIYAAAHGRGRGPRALMVNYRVDDLDAFLQHLRDLNVDVRETLDDRCGRFAYVDDPEGNPIEIWTRQAQ